MPTNTKAKLETEKFEIAALAHIDSIYRFALYMAENESDAQDLVQNTYLKAYRSSDRFEERTNCKVWLLAVLNNMLVNTIRRDGRHPQMVYPSEREERRIELAGDAGSEDETFRGLLNKDVAAAISELPIRYRAVVLLADIEGLSYKEIADIVGCPVETVTSRLCRGRKLLRKRLQSWLCGKSRQRPARDILAPEHPKV